MIKQVFTLFCALFMISVLGAGASAHPPSALTLTYAFDTKTLHIGMTHVSTSLREHRIRKIVIYKNEEEVKDISLISQTTPSSVVQDVVLDAKEKDVIRVKAICSEAGSAEEVLTVQEAVEEK